MVGGVHGGERNGFIDPLEAFMDAVAGGLSNALPLGAQANTVHGFNGFHRIIACRRFRREHDGIGGVEHGVSHVEDFRTGRERRFDHRLHHLRSRNHRTI